MATYVVISRLDRITNRSNKLLKYEINEKWHYSTIISYKKESVLFIKQLYQNLFCYIFKQLFWKYFAAS